MKKIFISFIAVFCLFSGMKVFSQCIVSGGNLKKPIEYTSVEAVIKDAKKIKKAAQNGEVTITFPKTSSFRNEESFRQLFNDPSLNFLFFKEKFYEGKSFDEYFADAVMPSHGYLSLTLSDCLKTSSKVPIVFKFSSDGKVLSVLSYQISGLYTPTQLYEKLLQNEREANNKAGFGSVTNAELAKEREENEKLGYGLVTNVERDEIIAKREAEEEKKRVAEFLKPAKDFENKKQWCYALGEYYKILENMTYNYSKYRSEIRREYDRLASIIASGKPGDGNYDEFSLYDEWKKLLMEAEKFGTEYGRYSFLIGDLKKGELDYTTKTATYSCDIKIEDSEIYEAVFTIIKNGYKNAYKSDWKDLPSPENWPVFSVSGISNNKDFVNGVAIYRQDGNSYNSFACNCAGKNSSVETNLGVTGRIENFSTLYDLKLNVIDENGKELLKSKRILIESHQTITFYGYGQARPTDGENIITYTGVPQNIMEKIDNGKAKLNVVSLYLQYGTYNAASDTYQRTGDKRSFIKQLKEIEFPLEKVNWKISN
ncbi:hypothetical protein [Treponema sp.]|uniref:hypothetical protein n=1 Tax=Treponema sp. TaxID=166 RepID=UPI0025EC2DBA|nr:hypothetical protein [Treponema sp.]MBR4323402.1 hypothetical protein [Treponema sp.]